MIQNPSLWKVSLPAIDGSASILGVHFQSETRKEKGMETNITSRSSIYNGSPGREILELVLCKNAEFISQISRETTSAFHTNQCIQHIEQ